jgi:hypothetical protein
MYTHSTSSATIKKIERSLAKYLSQYAEPEIAIAQQLTLHDNIIPCQHCLVIPAYDENDKFIQRIQQTFNNKNTARLLVITVINQPDSEDNSDKNQQLWDTLVQTYRSPTSINNYSNPNDLYRYQLLSIGTQVDLLLVDRFHHKIPQQQGVGLARKIGGDIACQLINDKKIATLWVNFSDADTHLPANYFSSLTQRVAQTDTTTYSAAIYPYTHISSDHIADNTSNNSDLDQATRYYEQHLHYYVNGLKRAGSLYAYHTLGSCIASNAYHYCQARGFPKRSGGEDFYLLNKLAKLGDICELKSPILHIESRFSHRVPFGTGPAVEKIVERLQLHNTREKDKTTHIDYHPFCFTELAVVIKHLDCIFDYKKQKDKDEDTALRKATDTHYLPWLEQLSQPLQTSLIALGIAKLFLHIDKQIKSHAECHKHCHYWLDAFKTLKLIHLLTEHYPKIAVSYPDS